MVQTWRETYTYVPEEKVFCLADPRASRAFWTDLVVEQVKCRKDILTCSTTLVGTFSLAGLNLAMDAFLLSRLAYFIFSPRIDIPKTDRER